MEADATLPTDTLHLRGRQLHYSTARRPPPLLSRCV